MLGPFVGFVGLFVGRDRGGVKEGVVLRADRLSGSIFGANFSTGV
jgi:hypothetical protein